VREFLNQSARLTFLAGLVAVWWALWRTPDGPLLRRLRWYWEGTMVFIFTIAIGDAEAVFNFWPGVNLRQLIRDHIGLFYAIVSTGVWLLFFEMLRERRQNGRG